MKSTINPYESPFSYGFPIKISIFLWFSYGFPMVPVIFIPSEAIGRAVVPRYNRRSACWLCRCAAGPGCDPATTDERRSADV